MSRQERLEVGSAAEAMPELVRPDWWAQASCRGKPAGWFFPDKGDAVELVLARRVCGACAVKSRCLAFALAESGIDGVWAGTTPEQRRRMRPRTVL
jgi:WhiB family redox-sensing transcriptional regulator